MRLCGHARALRCRRFGFQPLHRVLPGAGKANLPGYDCKPISMLSSRNKETRDRKTIICAPASFPRTSKRDARRSSISLNLAAHEAKANLFRSHDFAAAVMPLLGRCAKSVPHFAISSRKILVSIVKIVKREMLKEEEDLEPIYPIVP